MEEAEGPAVAECRACLREMDGDVCQNLFQEWCTTWAVPGTTVGDFMSKFADIEITENDTHSKVVCPDCYSRLAEACSFMKTVQRSDTILRKRYENQASADTDMETSKWHQPILLCNNLNESIDKSITDSVDIKEENVSEDEAESNLMDQDWEPTMDIKIEPEEFVAPAPLNIKVNGPCSLKGAPEPIQKPSNNIYYEEASYLDNNCKKEPHCEEEILPDLPLECMLCTEVFNNVNSLKDHVISKHSYGTVKRKSDDQRQVTDRRKVFNTRKDLTKNDSCHVNYTCSSCNTKFNKMQTLTRHRSHCPNRHKQNFPRSSTTQQLPARPNHYLSNEKQKANTMEKPTKNKPSRAENNAKMKATKQTQDINSKDQLNSNIPESESPNCIDIQNKDISEPSPSNLSVDSLINQDNLPKTSIDITCTNKEVQHTEQGEPDLLNLLEETNSSNVQEPNRITGQDTNLLTEDLNLISAQDPNIVTEQNPNLVTEKDSNVVNSQEPNVVTVQEPNIVSIQELNLVTGQDSNTFTGQEPNLETEQELNLVTEQKPNLVTEQEPNLIAGQKLNLVTEQKPNLVSEQELNLVTEQKPNLVIEQEPNLIAGQKSNLVTEQKPNLVSEQELNLVTEQKPNLVIEQEPNLIAGQKSNLATEQKPNLVSEQELNLVTEQEPNIVTGLGSKIVIRQETNIATGQETNLVPEPQPNQQTREESDLITKPEPNLATVQEKLNILSGQEKTMLQKLEFENSSDNEDGNRTKPVEETIPNTDELSQNMKVHLAINPLTEDDAIVLENKLNEDDSDKSGVRYKLKLVDISELTDKNLNQ